MRLTPYHAKYYAYELTRRCPPDSDDRLASALVDARVDLNPHQIEAALFAFRSPLSRGVLLADEVGLGKTIEAGLVLAQKWAERRRRVLVVTPANLRKQWHQELTDKFFLPCRILETRSSNDEIDARARAARQPGGKVLTFAGEPGMEPQLRGTRCDCDLPGGRPASRGDNRAVA